MPPTLAGHCTLRLASTRRTKCAGSRRRISITIEFFAKVAVIATTDRLRTLMPFGVLLFAGGLSALGFAPLNLWPLTFLSLVLLIHSVMDAKRLREAVARGWVFGVAHFIVGLNWIATAFTYQDNMPAWLGW